MLRLGQIGRRTVPKLRQTAPLMSTTRSFHSSFPSRDTEKEVAVEPPKKILLTPGYIIDKLGLDDWKRSVPLGIFLAIPAFKQNLIVLDVETQLLGCFILFVGTIYHKFGDAIGAALDAKGDAILEEQNKLEDQQIESIQQVIEQHRLRMEAADIMRDMVDLQRETVEKSIAVYNLKMPHLQKEAALALLDMEVSRQTNEWHTEEARLIDDAMSTIVKQIQTDKKLKKLALEEAMITLADPKAASKKDAISSLFIDHFKKISAEAKKAASVEREITEEERNALIERINAKAMRFSYIDDIEEQAEAAKKLIPSRFSGSLTKAFLEAQRKARSPAA